jgi:hypothetical protein
MTTADEYASLHFDDQGCVVEVGSGPARRMPLLVGGPVGSAAHSGDEWIRVARVRQVPLDGWAADNLHILGHLSDVRLGELCAVPAGFPGFRHWGRFTANGVEGGLSADRTLNAVWSSLLDRFGALPWQHVDIVLGDHQWPRGVSFPGFVLLAGEIVDRIPLAGRYVYLTHELVHQWLGNLGVLPEEQKAESEALVDAVARLLTCQNLPASARGAYQSLYRAYQTSSVAELVSRGDLVEAYYPVLEQGEQMRLLREQLDTVRAGIAATGERCSITLPAIARTGREH